MQLVLVAHRSGAAFQVGHVAPVLTDDERALKLPGVARVDAEIGRELHGAAHALGDVDKRAVGEHGRVEGGEIIVGVGHDRTEVFAHQLGVFAHGFREGTEDDALLLQPLLEGGLDRHGVHHRIDRDSGQRHAFFERNAELFERFHQFGIDFLLLVFLFCGVGVVVNRLIVDVGQPHQRPIRAGEREPMAVSRETKLEKPLRLAFLVTDLADDVFVEPGFEQFGLDVGHETRFVFLFGETFEIFVGHKGKLRGEKTVGAPRRRRCFARGRALRAQIYNKNMSCANFPAPLLFF